MLKHLQLPTEAGVTTLLPCLRDHLRHNQRVPFLGAGGRGTAVQAGGTRTLQSGASHEGPAQVSGWQQQLFACRVPPPQVITFLHCLSHAHSKVVVFPAALHSLAQAVATTPGRPHGRTAAACIVDVVCRLKLD